MQEVAERLKQIKANPCLVLIPGGAELVSGQNVHPGGRRRHRSFDVAADQSRFALGARQTGAQLRTRPEGEK